MFRVARLFPARLPVRCRWRDVLAGLFLFDRTNFELGTESDACQEIRQTFLHLSFRILLVKVAQMIFDVPFGDGINSFLITRSGAFFFENPLTRQPVVGVQLLNDNLGFTAVFTHWGSPS